MPDHRFINIQAPEEARSRRTLWSRSTRRRQEGDTATDDAGRQSREATASSQGQHEETETALAISPLRVEGSSFDATLGTYPVPGRTYFAAALRYFTVTLAPHVPYIARPGSRTPDWEVWWPRMMEEPAFFLTQILTAVSGLNRRNAEPFLDEVDLISLRVEVIQRLNQMLQDPARSQTDTAVATVLHVAAHEVYFGGRGTFETHLTGLRMMTALRGGFNAFDVSMRRALRWLDSIQSCLTRHATFSDPGGAAETLPTDEETALLYPSHGPSILIETIHECLGLFLAPECGQSPAFEKISLLLVSLGVLAVEYYTDDDNPSDDSIIAAECDSISSELMSLEEYFASGSSYDAYARRSSVPAIAAECIRIAMIATVLDIRRTVRSPAPEHRALNEENRVRLQRLNPDRLRGTDFDLARRYAIGVLGPSRDRLNLPTVPTLRSNVPSVASGAGSPRHSTLPFRGARSSTSFRGGGRYEPREEASEEEEEEEA
ncbi:MAG: hypothetical protein M1828_000242 [Chrysothrix sp. TS-e1954]|nr:MAG: hypothetical protein M1828_000242 [Chrysothrix sp. TS-e1954]